MQLRFRARVGRVGENAARSRLRQKLVQQLEPLGAEGVREHGDAGEIAARAVEARREAKAHRVRGTRKDDRDRRGGGFRRDRAVAR